MAGARQTMTRRLERRRRRVCAALSALACAIGLGALAGAATAQSCDCEPYTFLLSSSAGGGIPNGPSRNAAISQDARIGRVAAFESDASNIVSGDTNGRTDVFVVFRKSPWD